MFIDGDDRNHDAVFGKMLAVANDHVLDFLKGTGIDHHAACRHLLASICASVRREFDGMAAKVVPAVEVVTMAHYAAAFQQSLREPDKDPRKQFERLRKSLHDVVRMRHCENARERMKIEYQWLELERQRSAEAKTPAATESAVNSNEAQPITEEELNELLKKLLRPTSGKSNKF